MRPIARWLFVTCSAASVAMLPGCRAVDRVVNTFIPYGGKAGSGKGKWHGRVERQVVWDRGGRAIEAAGFFVAPGQEMRGGVIPSEGVPHLIVDERRVPIDPDTLPLGRSVVLDGMFTTAPDYSLQREPFGPSSGFRVRRITER